MTARSLLAVATLFLGFLATPAEAADPAADAALDELRDGRSPANVVQNRFFLKAERFEVAPVLGYVPNNPFVKRYVGGVLLAYHFSENFAAEGAIMYAPDLGNQDLKGLTHTLVNIARETDSGSDSTFQQPLEKMILGATFAARWAPVYGKINLIGERVINFDMYGVAGLGMLSIQEYYAFYDAGLEQEPKTNIGSPNDKIKVPVNVGLGMDFFLNSTVALKIDARSYLYVDKKPQYDSEGPPIEESRLYNNFIASVGLGVYFPSMKPRMENF